MYFFAQFVVGLVHFSYNEGSKNSRRIFGLILAGLQFYGTLLCLRIYNYSKLKLCKINAQFLIFFPVPLWCYAGDSFETGLLDFSFIGIIHSETTCAVLSPYNVNEKTSFLSLEACIIHFIIFIISYFLNFAEMTMEVASLLVELIFKTLAIYDDRGSRKAVDDLIVKSLSEVAFMRSFAATLVQIMEKQFKSQSQTGCHRLIKWSCLLLTESQFTSVSKNALCRVAQVQASVLHIAMQGSFRVKRACKQYIYHLFLKVPSPMTVLFFFSLFGVCNKLRPVILINVFFFLFYSLSC